MDSNPGMHIRHLQVDLSRGFARHWAGGDAYRSMLLNALSMMFPTGEQFFIDAVKAALPRIEGKADAGLAIAEVAQQYRLDFIPLQRERYDLLVHRREYFEEPTVKLMDFATSDTFAARAAEMAGYDVSGLGNVVYNSP